MRGQWLPFVKWIQDAVDIIDDNCNIWNLDYQNGDFDYDDGCVQIFQTITILWDDDDYVFYNERDFVDNGSCKLWRCMANRTLCGKARDQIHTL